MRASWIWIGNERFVHAASSQDGAATPPREMRIAALIEGAPEFPMEDIAGDLMLKMQGGLRGFVRDEELN